METRVGTEAGPRIYDGRLPARRQEAALAGRGRPGRFALRDAGTGELLRSFRASKGKTRFVALSQDGKWIASLDVSGNDPPYWGLWDAATGKEFRKLPAPVGSEIGEPNEPVFSPDGKKLASSGECDGLIHMWDVETGNDISLLGEHKGVVCAMGFSVGWPAVRRLPGAWMGASACGTPKRRPCGVGSRWTGTSGFRPWGPSLFRGIHGRRWRRASAATPIYGIFLWAKRWASLCGFGYPAWDAAFAPDGKTLATLGEGLEGVQLWDADSGKKTAPISVGRVERCSSRSRPMGKHWPSNAGRLRRTGPGPWNWHFGTRRSGNGFASGR